MLIEYFQMEESSLLRIVHCAQTTVVGMDSNIEEQRINSKRTDVREKRGELEIFSENQKLFKRAKIGSSTHAVLFIWLINKPTLVFQHAR